MLINFIKTEVFKENREKKYNRDLWIGIAGTVRNKVTTIDVSKEYENRFTLEHFLKLSMDKMQSSNPKKDEDFMLMTWVAYHALYKNADLLNEINIRPWRNKKTIQAKSPSNIFRAASISDVLIKYIQRELKKGIPGKRNIRKSFTSKKNQSTLDKDRN